MEQERIQRYKIEPQLESQLRSAQADVNLSGLPLASVSVSGLHKALIVTLDADKMTSEKDSRYYEQMLKGQHPDLPIIVREGKSIDTTCIYPGSNCDSIIGGIAIEDTNGAGCSIGLGIPRNDITGFITALVIV